MSSEPRCAVHADVAALGPCDRCGTFICAACKGATARLLCAKCQGPGVAPRTPTLWDARRTPLALVRTLWSMAHDPVRFARDLDPEGDLWAVMLFPPACMVGIPVALSFSPRGDGHLEAVAGVALVAFVAAFLGLCGFACALHLGCLTWKAHSFGLEGTTRVVGYAAGPLVLAPVAVIVPVLLPAAALAILVLGVFFVCNGLVYTCGATWTRAVAAVVCSPAWLPVVALVVYFNAGTYRV